jgi:hypothetical protein
MATISLAEVVNKACELKTKKEKVEWLKQHNTNPLRTILKVMYDKNMELNIPKSTPPYTASEMPDSHGMLYRETRKIPYFVKGYSGDGLTQMRREQLFIQMLETVDKEDAVLLCKMIQQKPLKGLTVAVIEEAMGNFITETEGTKE